MAENTKIEWADHTVNFWWGCTKVSPACANCYAEGLDARFYGHDDVRGKAFSFGSRHWGPDASRLIRTYAAGKEADRFQRRAEKEGRRFRVFTNSMSDFFEDRRDLDKARAEALMTIRCTPNLDWMVLTKRPEAILRLLTLVLNIWEAEPSTIASRSIIEWLERWISGDAPANVWLGATVEDQERADLRIPALLSVPARVRFLSCEPLLGPLDLGLQDCWLGFTPTRELLHWVICGGESGPRARPLHPSWARGLRDQCATGGVPFLFKQWGEWIGGTFDSRKGKMICESATSEEPIGRIFWTNPGEPAVRIWEPKDHYWDHASARVGKMAAGRQLDGQLHDGYPGVADV